MQSDEIKTEEQEELIQNKSAKEISKKTNLSVNVIQNLFNKKFESFSYPQAIGSISIIEREFDMELNSLKDECIKYFKEHPVEDGVSVLKPIKEDKPLIPKILILTLLGVILYSGWYFFVEYYNKQIIPTSTTHIIELERTVLQKSDTIKKKIVAEERPKEIEDRVQEVTDRDINSTISTKRDEENRTTQSVDNKIDDGNISIAQEEKRDDENISNSNILPQIKIVAEEPIKKELTIVTPPPTPRKIITLIPNEYMWFRLINLTDKKRRAYKRSAKYKIDMRENDWLFAAENASFSFKDLGKTALYGGEGKLFYKLDQSGIHKLTEKEFRALEK